MATFYMKVCNECSKADCKEHEAYHLVGLTVSYAILSEAEVLSSLGYTREEVLKDLKTEEVLQGWIESLSFNPQE